MASLTPTQESRVQSKLRNLNVVVALGIPSTANIEKFKKVFIDRILSKFCPDVGVDSIKIPLVDGPDGTKVSAGVAFIRCGMLAEAQALAERGDQALLDAKHPIRFLGLDAFKNIIEGRGAPEAPAPAPQLDRPQHFSWFLVDQQLRDQLVYLSGSNSNPYVFWFNHTTASLESVEMPHRLQGVNMLRFTPDGSMLVTKKGDRVTFSCGENWIDLASFNLPKVKDWDISPDGIFVVLKTDAYALDNTFDPRGAAIYDLRTGARLRKVPLDKDDYNNMRWAVAPGDKKDGCVLLSLRRQAGATSGEIVSYSGKGFSVVETFATGVRDFLPSPTDKVVFAFHEEIGGAPPKISFISTVTKQNVIVTPSYNTLKVQAYWHPKKPLCAVAVTPTSKRDSMSLLLFDLSQARGKAHSIKDIKGTIVSVSWEPVSRDPKAHHHLAVVVHSDSNVVQTYEIGDTSKSGEVAKLLHSFPTTGSVVRWSHFGRFAFAEDTEKRASSLQFFDLYESGGQIRTAVLDKLTTADWDPTGVFVLAACESGIRIFLCDGTQILKKDGAQIKCAAWRPMPATEIPDYAKVVEENAEAIERGSKLGAIDSETRDQERQAQRMADYKAWVEANEAPGDQKWSGSSRTVEYRRELPSDE